MPQPVDVPLDEFLSDLDPRAIKKGVSAPLGYLVDGLLKVVHDHVHDYWPLLPADLVEALVFDAKPDAEELRRVIRQYKNARVWEVRQRLGEPTTHTGIWEVQIRTQGERAGG